MSGQIYGLGESIHGRATDFLYEHPDLPEQQRELLSSIKMDTLKFRKSAEELLRQLLQMSGGEWERHMSRFYADDQFFRQTRT